MSAIPVTYNSGAVKPIECLRAGWNLIKDQYWLFLGITAVGILIGSFGPMAILLGPMMCGIYMCLFARIRGEPVSFELLFKGFDYFKQSLIASLIQAVPVMLLMLPTYAIFFILIMNKTNSGRGRGGRGAPVDPSEIYPLFIGMFVVMMGVVVIAGLIGALFIFTYPLIVDRRLGALDALRTSFKAVMANLGGVLGLVLLGMVLGFAGLLLCYVGAFLLLPITFASWAVAYRRVFPAEA